MWYAWRLLMVRLRRWAVRWLGGLNGWIGQSSWSAPASIVLYHSSQEHKLRVRSTTHDIPSRTRDVDGPERKHVNTPPCLITNSYPAHLPHACRCSPPPPPACTPPASARSDARVHHAVCAAGLLVHPGCQPCDPADPHWPEGRRAQDPWDSLCPQHLRVVN